MTAPLLHLVPHGPPARSTLVEVIGTLKTDDPLAPVTVAAPSHFAGLSLRRTLAGAGGFVNVRFMPLARVAELLGAADLAAAGQRPRSSTVTGAGIRRVLGDDPGVFADVADDPATEQALGEMFAELRPLPDEALDRIAGLGPRPGDLVRLFRAFRNVTAGFYDDHDLFVAATEAVTRATPTLADVGTVVWHLPRSAASSERALIGALAAAGHAVGILGLTGDPEVDASTERLAATLEPALGPVHRAPPPAPADPARIVRAPDPEEELRVVVRGLRADLEAGTPPHRIAIVSRRHAPYGLTADTVFAEAEVPHHGPSPRSLAHTAPGRALAGLLALAAGGRYARHEVVGWLHSAPILRTPSGPPVPADRWDRVSRLAGVTAGRTQWARRLAHHAERLERRRDEAAAAGDGERVERHTRAIDDAEALAQFVAELMAALRPPRLGWAEIGAWAIDLVHRYLGGDLAHVEWPDHEIEALRAIEAGIEGLGVLDEIEPDPDLSRFRRALDRILEAPAPRTRRFGEGVFVGRVADLVGTDFDVVHVVGMVEGEFPTRGRASGLVTEAEREALDDALPSPRRRRIDERYEFSAALAAATTRVLSFPATDPRAGREQHPSPWLLEAASRRAGEALYAPDLDRHDAPWLVRIPSPEGALRTAAAAASASEQAQRALLAAADAAGPGAFDPAPILPKLLRGFQALSGRAGDRATVWDGLTGPVPEHFRGRLLSPTSLQTWARCPFRYFLEHVLSVEAIDDPEEIESLDARDRGNVVHEILERFVAEHIAAGSVPAPHEPWSDASHARLDAVADEVFEAYEARGRTGRPLLWELEQVRLRRELHRALGEDDRLRATHGVVPIATEWAFGNDDRAAVEIERRSGPPIRMRGIIDRVDRAPDGSRLRVVDYKTGSVDPFGDDPVEAGTRLQLPVYARAAQQGFGDVPVHAEYWKVSERHRFGTEGFEVTDDVRSRFAEVIEMIATGIEDGVFPARPGDDTYDYVAGRDTYDHCLWCEYDRVCPTERSEAWQRKQADPGVAVVIALSDGPASSASPVAGEDAP